MKLVQLIYTSTASAGLGEGEVLDILRKSQGANLARKITGLLLYRDGCFLQLLEGDEGEVMALFERISRDPRHSGVIPLWEGPAERAAMPTWAMAYFSPTAADRAEGNGNFVLSPGDARRICEALPSPIGAPFLRMLNTHPAAAA